MIYYTYLGTAGLADVGYEFFNAASVSLGARSQANVIDRADGWYSADITTPVNSVEIRWDSTSTGRKAREETGTTSPTAAQIRQEMDDNSTKLALLLLVPRIGTTVLYRNLGCTPTTQTIGLEAPP